VLKKFDSHPGIVSIDTAFKDNGTAYLVMEYLEGATMEEFLARRGGKFSFETALRIMLPVIDALSAVHAEGILHRDVSPDNIYITLAGAVKLIDFGAARNALGQKSHNLSVILKEGYAPEEQYRLTGVQGPWTDVYATAATMYHAITGKIPQPALDRLAEDTLQTPTQMGVAIDPQSEAALMKALAVKASARFGSMEDFKSALTGKADGSTITIEEPVPPIPVPQPLAVPPPPAVPQPPAFPPSGYPQQSAVPQPPPVPPSGDPAGYPPPIGPTVLQTPFIPPQQFPAGQGYSTGQPYPPVPPPAPPVMNYAPPPVAPPISHHPPVNPPKGRWMLPTFLGVAALAVIGGLYWMYHPHPTPDPNPTPAPGPIADSNPTPQPVPVPVPTPNPNPNPNPGPKGQTPNPGPSPTPAPIPNPGPPPVPVPTPTPTPAPVPNPTPRVDAAAYDGMLRQSNQAFQNNNPQQAAQLLMQAIQADPARPKAYDSLAQIQLYGFGQLAQASENYQASIDRGGTATFHVRHDHGIGTFATYCEGWLYVSRAGVQFMPLDNVHAFTASRAQMVTFGANGVVPGTGADLHSMYLKLANGATYNFAPISKFTEQERALMLKFAGK
jgi:serine/threonine protein kinase